MVLSEYDRVDSELKLKCLDVRRSDCDGGVEYHESLSGTGTPIPRCDFHWDKRLEKQEEINRDYPDSPIPPAWFDPSMAGESWDED